jgi:DNA repair MmcB-like protein
LSVAACEILELLRAKHSADVFVDECKDGPTHSTEHRRLDAWSMDRSWAHPYVVGYEIKVSRSDFLRDQKWRDYLSMCNSLYFVTPAGLVDPAEIPEGVGLMCASKSGGKLFIKRRAAYRNVVIAENVWRYILMCRTKITRDRTDYAPSGRQAALDWLDEKKADYHLGQKVSARIARLAGERIAKIESENKKLTDLFEHSSDALKLVEEMGGAWQAREILEQAKHAEKEAIGQRLIYDMRALRANIDRLLSGIEKREALLEVSA